MSELNQLRVAQMKAGDETAFEWLLDRYEKPVYRFLFCSVGNAELAGQLSGDVFGEFVFALKADKLRDPERLAGFIFGIARNVLRRAYARKGGFSLDQTETLREIPCNRPGVPEQVAAQEELDRALHRIGQFRDQDRQVMLLRFVEGLKLQAIAEVLDIPINTVKVTIHRCRKNLQADFQHNL